MCRRRRLRRRHKEEDTCFKTAGSNAERMSEPEQLRTRAKMGTNVYLCVCGSVCLCDCSNVLEGGRSPEVQRAAADVAMVPRRAPKIKLIDGASLRA